MMQREIFALVFLAAILTTSANAEKGIASITDTQGKMANGHRFRADALTAAHRSLPLGSCARVVRGSRSVQVKIADRGPFRKGRIIDLTPAAARALGMGKNVGLAKVEVTPCQLEAPPFVKTYSGDPDNPPSPEPTIESENVSYPLQHPIRISGKLQIGDGAVRFVSGGIGRGAIPYGSYKITPGAIGSWGARHGAIGINGNHIYDPHLKKSRYGIEIHATRGSYATAGCIGIAREEWRKFKRWIFGTIEKNGEAWIHVHPKAVAVTPSKNWSPAEIKLSKVIEDSGPPRRAKRHARHRSRLAYRHHQRFARR